MDATTLLRVLAHAVTKSKQGSNSAGLLQLVASAGLLCSSSADMFSLHNNLECYSGHVGGVACIGNSASLLHPMSHLALLLSDCTTLTPLKQGYADNSTWSRGQAWAMAGFSKLYEETNMPEFRDTAIKVVDKYLQLLERQEKQAAARGLVISDPSVAKWDRWVPMWDFDAPFKPEVDGPRDTSGGAVAALGMLHLARTLSDEDAAASQKYLCAAVSTLRALSSSKYLAQPGAEHFGGIVKHATGGMPLGMHIDVGLITADYYFLEALQMCNSWDACRNFGL
jgi:hypothetical protein